MFWNCSPNSRKRVRSGFTCGLGFRVLGERGARQSAPMRVEGFFLQLWGVVSRLEHSLVYHRSMKQQRTETARCCPIPMHTFKKQGHSERGGIPVWFRTLPYSA
eukprot:3314903-Pyramimonas_sp.AAC.1